MRISDWSSDVCSSDLRERKESPTTYGVCRDSETQLLVVWRGGLRGENFSSSPLQGRGSGGLAACCPSAAGEGIALFPSPSFASSFRTKPAYPPPPRGAGR